MSSFLTCNNDDSDFLPIMANPAVFSDLISVLISNVKKHAHVDIIIGLDARGFLLGPVIAHQLSLKFVPVRKAGVYSESFTKIAVLTHDYLFQVNCPVM
jgi:adenine/guanine phosphoribosyltransferase-like PRPP-binding protein